MSEEAHSEFSASGFEAAMLCPGKVVLEHGREDRTSVYAAEGTVAHYILAKCLEKGDEPDFYRGMTIAQDGHDILVDIEMVGHLETSLQWIADVCGPGLVMSEQRVCYARYLGLQDGQAWGTADVLAFRPKLVIVGDLKYGKSVVPPDAPQLKLYALGAIAGLRELDMIEPGTRVRTVIFQPRVFDEPQVAEFSVEELERWAEEEAVPAVKRRQLALLFDDGPLEEFASMYLQPGQKQCKYCRARGDCPALKEEVIESVFEPAAEAEWELIDAKQEVARRPVDGESWLSVALSKVDLIEDWCKGVRALAERMMLAGAKLPGFKLVKGKKGNRAWTDETEAARRLREQFGLSVEDAHKFKVISPAQAEKLRKAGRITEQQWELLQDIITQRDGSLHVAPDHDPREAIPVKSMAEEFELLEGGSVADPSEFA